MDYEIIDDNGVIDSGTQEEMTDQFEKYTTGEDELDWEGDLKLIIVIARYK